MPPRSFARNLRPFALVTILGASATGCTLFDEFFDENVSLTEFAPVGAHVSVELTDIPRSQLVLEPKDGVCPTIKDDIAARVDDKSMDVFIQGGKQPSGKSWICGMPTFRRNVAAADMGGASTKFVVDDDTATFTIVATGLLRDRTFISAKDVPVDAGVETSFEWPVPTDVIDPDLLMADFVYDDAALALTSEIEARVEGSMVVLRLPTNAPAGMGKLQLDVTADVPVEKCEGVRACTASVHAVTELSLKVSAAEPPSP
jgi:hypothetical protein